MSYATCAQIASPFCLYEEAICVINVGCLFTLVIRWCQIFNGSAYMNFWEGNLLAGASQLTYAGNTTLTEYMTPPKGHRDWKREKAKRRRKKLTESRVPTRGQCKLQSRYGMIICGNVAALLYRYFHGGKSNKYRVIHGLGCPWFGCVILKNDQGSMTLF